MPLRPSLLAEIQAALGPALLPSLTASSNASDFYRMEGPQRALLYRVAIETGLRANELRSLIRASLRLDDAVPCIVVKARSTKNERDARQGIHPTCVALLREHVANINLTMDTYGHLFPGQLSEAVARMGETLAGGPADETTRPQRATGTTESRPQSVQCADGGTWRVAARRTPRAIRTQVERIAGLWPLLAIRGETRRQ